MEIHKGHRERVKQEFLEGGLSAFSEIRVLELLLFYSRRQGDVNPLAHTLLDHFGSLAGVLDADMEDLRKINGVGDNTAVLLKLIPAIGAKYLSSRSSFDGIIQDSRDIRSLLAPHFFGAKNEMSFLVGMDSKQKVLGVRKLSEGIPTSTEISAQQIMKTTFSLNATRIILAHNHVGGVALPSPVDISTTLYLQDLLKKVGIILYDHVIMVDDDMVSLRDSRRLRT